MNIEQLRKDLPDVAAFLDKIAIEQIGKITDEQILFGNGPIPEGWDNKK